MAGEFGMTVDVKGVDRLIRRFNDRSWMQNPIRDLLTKGSLEIAGQTRRLTPVDTGRLRSSISQEVDKSQMPLWAKVGTNVEYAAPVEFGRRPGSFPPLAAIRAWTIRKGIGAGAAFPIAQAIARRGTKGAHMFRKGLRRSQRVVRTLAEQAAYDIESLWGKQR